MDVLVFDCNMFYEDDEFVEALAEYGESDPMSADPILKVLFRNRTGEGAQNLILIKRLAVGGI